MTRLVGTALALACAGALALLPGCKQGVGDRCQIDSDCDDSANLICVIPSGGSAQSGGTCQPRGSGLDGGISTDLASSLPDLASQKD
jgi:hypothetical protein